MPGEVNIDLQRLARRGLPEAVFGAGKTTPQICEAVQTLNANGQNAMVTRLVPAQAHELLRELPGAIYHELAGIVTVDVAPLPERLGRVAVLAAGTSDVRVAEEAAISAERAGCEVSRHYDIGVAGIHRLFAQLDAVLDAEVLIVVAGMEGALPSVVGGLTRVPLIAVPTSIGYGSAFQGVTALLAMLNSCAAGITVVNIDNGFGAGIAASLILRVKGGRA